MKTVKFVMTARALEQMLDLPAGVKIDGATYDAVDHTVVLEVSAHDDDVFGDVEDDGAVSANYTVVEEFPGVAFAGFIAAPLD